MKSVHNPFLRKIYENSKLMQYAWMRIRWARMYKLLEKSDVDFICERFEHIKGYPLNLTDPRTFDEKLNYYKLCCRDPLVTVCSDKIKAREYVEQCGFGDILIPHYATYSNAEDVEFDKLPSPCYIKWNLRCLYPVNIPLNRPYI